MNTTHKSRTSGPFTQAIGKATETLDSTAHGMDQSFGRVGRYLLVGTLASFALGIYQNRTIDRYEQNLREHYYPHIPAVLYTPKKGDALKYCAQREGFGGGVPFRNYNGVRAYITFVADDPRNKGRLGPKNQLLESVPLYLPTVDNVADCSPR